MSCQLKLLAFINDVAAVKKFLFQNEHDVDTEPDDNWDMNWEWTDVNSQDEKTIEKTDVDTWLNSCVISVSPLADTIIIANENKVVSLTAKWDSQETGDVKTKYHVVWKENINTEDYENITSVICLPLSSQKRSSHGGADWTCVVIGFNSGYIRMYTETGVLLLSQLLHTEAVIKLKCQTFKSSRNPSQAELSDELIIVYPSVVVTIDGFSLIQTLRACRNQVARAAASGNDSIHPPPLAYKKWSFSGTEKVTDCDTVGIVAGNTFDHLQNASLIGGFSAVPKSTVPSSSVFLTSGINPYISFFYVMEGATQPLISEVAFAVASKLKNALFSAASGLLSFSGKTASENSSMKPKIEPATKLPLRFCIPDLRCGDTVRVSPNKTLAAVTDSYGRVVLLDVKRGIAVRIWKGYRDAQCGWLEADEDTHRYDKCRSTPVPRSATFLVIYAPRRGILEVWTMQQGPRVAAFNVGKNSRLFHIGYGMMGLNHTSSQIHKELTYSCLFVEPNGEVKSLDVPFHFALSDKNSKRARDLHLLKNLKSSIKNEDCLANAATEILSDMRTASIRNQALNTLLSHSKITLVVVDSIIDGILSKLNQQVFAKIDLESKLLMQRCERIKQLLSVYKDCCRLNKMVPDVTDSRVDDTEFRESVKSGEEEWTTLTELIDTHRQVSAKQRVSFGTEEMMPLSKFLSCFNISTGHLERRLFDATTLSIELSSDDHFELADMFFSKYLQDSSLFSDVCNVLSRSGISSQQLIELILLFWLSNGKLWNSWSYLLNFSSLIGYFFNKLDFSGKQHISEYIWNALTSSTNNESAYLACLAIRNVFVNFASEGASLSTDGSNVVEDEAENLVKSGISKCNELKMLLEDLLVLGSLLHCKVKKESANDFECFQISLNVVFEKGRGSVSEFVAQWCVRSQLKMQTIWDLIHGRVPDSAKDIDDGKICLVVEIVKRVQTRFQYSMDSDTILANVCWEHAVEWNKDPDESSKMAIMTEMLRLIASSLLRHGIAALLWRMFISKRFSATALLIEKVGKTPKERLCRKSIGIDDVILESFLKYCFEILDILLEANEPVGMETMPVFGNDRLWASCSQGPAPLVELAVAEKPTNYTLVRHHYQLALCLYTVVLFNMKNVKPLSLFSTKSQAVFFKELDLQISVPCGRVELTNSKTKFLERVVSAVVRTFLESGSPAGSQGSCTAPSPSLTEQTVANQWMAKIVKLGEMWGIDIDVLRRHYVCELYSTGLDSVGEEVLLSIHDRCLMGSQLMLILGQRLHHVVMETLNTADKLAQLSPSLSSWLKTLDQATVRCKSPPIKKTYSLARQVMILLPESTSEHKLAVDTIEALESLTSDSNCQS
ncbi:RAB3GAP2 (predicted) [Pycnogonum litorale]